MSVDKQKLKALANLATPGEWERDGYQVCPVADQNASLGSFGKSTDAAYVAALPPSVVLSLLAEIERLEAQVRLAGMAGEIAVHQAVGRAATDFGVAVLERDQLKAENEELRKDAERYRWLRDGAGYCDTRDIPGMAPARMDAFIDAALVKERGQ